VPSPNVVTALMSEDQRLPRLTAEAKTRLVRSRDLVQESACAKDEATRAIDESRALLKRRMYPF
jgi:hypothetical protein